LSSANGGLPAGHPFLNIFYDTLVNANDIGYYWSADLNPLSAGDGIAIQFQNFSSVLPALSATIFPFTEFLGVWCVRSSTGTPFQQ